MASRPVSISQPLLPVEPPHSYTLKVGYGLLITACAFAALYASGLAVAFPAIHIAAKFVAGGSLLTALYLISSYTFNPLHNFESAVKNGGWDRAVFTLAREPRLFENTFTLDEQIEGAPPVSVLQYMVEMNVPPGHLIKIYSLHTYGMEEAEKTAFKQKFLSLLGDAKPKPTSLEIQRLYNFEMERFNNFIKKLQGASAPA